MAAGKGGVPFLWAVALLLEKLRHVTTTLTGLSGFNESTVGGGRTGCPSGRGGEGIEDGFDQNSVYMCMEFSRNK